MLCARWLQRVRPKSLSRPYSTLPVQFQSALAARSFTVDLITPLDDVYSLPVIENISNQAQKWHASRLCRAMIGINNTKEVPLPGGDASRISKAHSDTFTKELELSLLLASFTKPYVAIMNGQVLGGLPGLAIHAPFRVATEQSVFQMPMHKLGHMCGGGVHHMLARMDGALGPFLALTGRRVHARAVFEQGIATHYIPERRIAELVQSISSFEAPTEAIYDMIDAAIEEVHYERTRKEEALSEEASGDVRVAIDTVYGLPTVREIVEMLSRVAGQEQKTWLGEWADEQLRVLKSRSPEALVIGLEAVRRGHGTLGSVLAMEDKLARVYMEAGMRDLSGGEDTIVEREWERFYEVDEKAVITRYFGDEEEGVEGEREGESRVNYGLPSEEEIRELVVGSHPRGVGESVGEIELFFYNLRGYKAGLREKIERVAKRCCVVDRVGRLMWIK